MSFQSLQSRTVLFPQSRCALRILTCTIRKEIILYRSLEEGVKYMSQICLRTSSLSLAYGPGLGTRATYRPPTESSTRALLYP